MIALIASVMLGLYVLVPVLIFDKVLSSFVPAKRITRTRTEEVFFGLVVVAVPILGTFLLTHVFWFFGHHPFPLNEGTEASVGRDYKVAIMALQSDSYLVHNESSVWSAVEHIKWRQLRFLTWTYVLLGIECGAFTYLVYHYGRLRKYLWYRLISKIFIQSVSEWHVLLTSYVFDPSENRKVHLDLLTKNELYTGVMSAGNYFFKPDGSLSGLMLKQTKRFKRSQMRDDRTNGSLKSSEEYWKDIAGDGRLYVPVEEISNINIRYEIGNLQLASELRNAAMQTDDIKQILHLLGDKTIDIQVSDINKPVQLKVPVDSGRSPNDSQGASTTTL
jgi:hypothetical protein